MFSLRTTNAQNIGARPYQEDCFSILEGDVDTPANGRCLAVVIADGMGGLAHGDIAARRAVQAFGESFPGRAGETALAQALTKSLLDANAAVLREATARTLPGKMGTTFIAAAVRNGCLEYVSTGDSGLFLVREGEIRRLNAAHVFGEYLDQQVERGELDEGVAMSHPHREALTSFIGMDQAPEIDRPEAPLELREGDMIVLATDGLFKTLSLAQMRAALDEPGDPAEALVRRALTMGLPQQDNVTVVAILCGADLRAEPGVDQEQEETAEMRRPDLPASSARRPLEGRKPLEARVRSEGGWLVWCLAVALAVTLFLLLR
ncbi:MAG: serine/threonine-protein phosphatase [Bryobacterales bacterium]|nr:serine/threonine-protein phosphatase [Bryobacterales bacterium]